MARLKISSKVFDGCLVEKHGAYYIPCRAGRKPVGVYHRGQVFDCFLVETGEWERIRIPEHIGFFGAFDVRIAGGKDG